MRTVIALAAALLLAGAQTAGAAIVGPSGYIFTTQLLDNLTQGCVAAGPGGTFVGIGPGFTANAQAVVLAKESGELRLVAMGFSSIADCAYDPASDTLYVTDNADNADLGITTSFANTGAQSGDTVFRIAPASTASGLSAADIELLPADSVEFAASLAVTASGDLLVTNSVGAGMGTVLSITAGPVVTPLISGLALSAGLALVPGSGNILVAENLGLPNFDNQIRQYTAAGVAVPPVPFAGPSFAFGSTDLLLNADGRLLASGNFGADVVSFDLDDSSSQTFVSGMTFASGMALDPFTNRVQILSSTFSGADEDKSLHRFTPIDQLVEGGGSPASDCAHEFYGLALVGKKAECVDGAACDGDGAANGSCLFPIGFCFNVADPDLPECSDADDVTEVELSANPPSAAVTASAAAVAAALPVSGSTCLFSDGYALPVKQSPSGAKDGKATVKLKTTTADGRKDTDVAKLVCKPAP
jgi:hypothetical protein